MRPPPKISVLVTVYNGERFLDECLESILTQDYTDYELLISDDCSADGSCAIIERFARRDARIRWWRNPVNLGLAGNFNHCLKSAAGEYVKYVLHDDKLISRAALSSMAAVLDAHRTVSLVGSATQIIDAESHTLEWRDHFFRTGVVPGRQVIARCLEEDKNLVGEPSVVMFRRAQAARGYNEQVHQLIDLELWCHLLEQGDYSHLAEPLCAFRQHADQESAAGKAARRHAEEYTKLLREFLTRPWLRQGAGRRILFRTIYSIRRRGSRKDPAQAVEYFQMMGARWYALYWVKYKFTRPFLNLWRWFGQRRSALKTRVKPAPASAPNIPPT